MFDRSLRPLIVALIPGQQQSLDKLKKQREHLSNEVAALINDFGPKLYDDFNEVSHLDTYVVHNIHKFTSGASWYHRPVSLPQAESRACGEERVLQVPLMPKGLALRTQ